MIPQPEEVWNDLTNYPFDNPLKIIEYGDRITPEEIHKAMKEYGRRLLDHALEKAKTNFEYGWSLDQDSIQKIKDEL